MKKYLMALIAVAMISAMAVTSFAYDKECDRDHNGIHVEETEAAPTEVKDVVINITNTKLGPEDKVISISGQKKWVGDTESDRPETITIHLYADGVDTGYKVSTDKADNWEYSFSNFPAYKDNKVIVYTVVEDAVEGYNATYIKK